MHVSSDVEVYSSVALEKTSLAYSYCPTVFFAGVKQKCEW